MSTTTILQSKSVNDGLRQAYNDNNLTNAISFKRYKFVVKRTMMHLAKGTSPSPFAFKYQNNDERVKVTNCMTYLMSDKFDEETKLKYDNDDRISNAFGYDRYKELCSVSAMLMTFHFIKSNRFVKTMKTD